MNNKIKILDVVALLRDIPQKKLITGQVGTVVEQLQDDVFEVEFSLNTGETIQTAALNAKDLLVLHYETEPA